jgi:hypothetical protein
VRELPWQHNFGSTATPEELRRFALAVVDWWNNVALPVVTKAEKT